MAVAGRVVFAARQCSGGLRGKGKRGEGKRPEQSKVVLQDERVTGVRACLNLPGRQNAVVDRTVSEYAGGGVGIPETGCC